MSKNINFTYDGAEYSINLTTKEDSFHYCNSFAVEVSATNNYVRVRKETEDVFSKVDNLVHEEKLALNKVRASEFLEWYIRDAEDYSMLGCKVYDLLRGSGKASLSVVDLFNQSPFIPADICEIEDKEAISYRTEDVIFIDDLTQMELSNEQKQYYYEQKF
jgi:hypothetical protein